MAPTIQPTARFVNLGHTFAHLLMLVFPTAVLAMEGTWGMGYAQLLPLGSRATSCSGWARCRPAGSRIAGAAPG